MSTEDPFIDRFNERQSTYMIIRRVQLSIGCLILGGIVANIIKRKIYVYNTTKLFMFCCICYLIGMLVVLLHLEYFTSEYRFSYQILPDPDTQKPEDIYDEKHYIYNIMNEMKSDGTSLFFCGFQAFINLFFYNLAYFFAVLVSYNVYCVLTDNYRNFMKNRLKSIKIWALLIAMFLIYLFPFVLMYVPSQFDKSSYFYSYGPAGFPTQLPQGELTRKSDLLLFCGINSGSRALPTAISLINIYIVSFVMLFYHSLLLFFNRTKIKQLVGGETYLNSKQQFLIQSGKISVIVFCIQLLNFVKLFIDISFYSAQTLLLILNFIFDCYPIVILYFFWNYTREKRGLQHGSSTLLNEGSQNSQ